MPVNLSIKNVPDAVAARLRERAERNHRSLQGELMAMIESTVNDPNVERANATGPRYGLDPAAENLVRKTGKPLKHAGHESRFAALRGTRHSGMTTGELMNLLRGYDEDAGDPGFKKGRKK